MAEWRIYGCGSASSGRSTQSSYEFVDCDVRLQIDFGNGAMYQRCRFEKNINPVLDAMDHCYISHGHHDHIGDFVRHIVAWKYTPGYTGKPVHLYCAEETLAHIHDLIGTSGFDGIEHEIYIPHLIEEEKSFTVGRLTLTPFSVRHIGGSLGVRIENEEGLKVAYTSDTTPFEDLAGKIAGQDLLVTEASYLEMEHFMHLNVEQAASLAAEARAKALVLAHFYPDVEALSEGDLKSRVSRWYHGEVHLAQDGLALAWDSSEQTWKPRRLF